MTWGPPGPINEGSPRARARGRVGASPALTGTGSTEQRKPKIIE